MDDLQLTVAILAGGDSRRFASEKALALFRGIPLIQHMLEIAKQISKRTIIVVSKDEQAKKLSPFSESVRIVIDPEGTEKSALNGAITAFEYAETDYTLLLPVDSPLANVPLLRTLYDLRGTHSAIVPSWPEGYLEPLHAVYRTEIAYSKGLRVYKTGGRKMQDLLDAMPNVLYVSTRVLRVFDSELRTFMNVNTERDLKNLERIAGKGG